jgi:hypothetical protein
MHNRWGRGNRRICDGSERDDSSGGDNDRLDVLVDNRGNGGRSCVVDGGRVNEWDRLDDGGSQDRCRSDDGLCDVRLLDDGLHSLRLLEGRS